MRLRLAAALGALALAAAASGCGEASRSELAPESAADAGAGAESVRAADPSAPPPDVAAAPPARARGLWIAYDAASDRLDLVARDVPLARVLAALVAETGVSLEDQSQRDHAELVSLRLDGVPLADGVRQLLEGQPKALGFAVPGAPGAPPRLASILLLPPRADRAAAVVAAVRRGDEAGARALAAELAGPGRAEERALAVRELADATAEEPIELRTRAVHALLALDRGAAARELARRLRDAEDPLARDPAARARVVWALGFVGDETSEAYLVEAFLGEDRAVRDAAAASLSRLRARRAEDRAQAGAGGPG